MSEGCNAGQRAMIAITITLAVNLTYFSTPAEAGDENDELGYYAGMNCGQLWYERNTIFANAGYCFKSGRAVATFGPACFAPYGRLSVQDKRTVKEIKYFERRRGC